MTTSQAPTDRDPEGTDRDPEGNPGPAQAFGMALNAVVGAVAGRLERKAADWIDRLEAVAGSGGLAERAGVEAMKARVQGRNPAWAAVVTSAVAAIVLLLVSPALLVVYLLSWLVIAAVQRSHPPRPRHPAAA